MWKIEITKSTKKEVLGSDDNGAQHIIDVTGLPTRPRVGDLIEGHKAGGAIIAHRFVLPETRRKYKITQRFALKREFSTTTPESGRLNYPPGAAVTVVCYANDNDYYIIFDRDKRENPASPTSHLVSEFLIDLLLTDE